MIHKNLTPFYWAPRITSRQPPQPEMVVCVRAVYRLEPGKDLEAIEDPIEQGFMSSDTFLLEDINQEGALQYPGDFAEWKLHGEALLTGACHPPNGPATSCDVRFSVGEWSKSLHIVGPRAYEKGLLLGGKLSEPQPFASMPLTWENAFGGPDYPANPAGRGHTGEEMPTMELPGKPLKKTGGQHVPATMSGINPNWPQRSGKRGKNYGPSWQKTRAPFYSDDFDWTHFQSAAPDQWIDGYFRGDEELIFENLHPTTPMWRTKLPGLRIRAFVKGFDDVVLEPEMHLDTVHADVGDGKLYLTWRGHVPVKETDLTDVKVVLIASEQLADAELPFAHYKELLDEFEEDPVGLNDAFPPGFLAVATAIEAAQAAERDGEPLPDLKAVADNMPADCPFPPWFLAAAAGEADPLGIADSMPANILDEEDPLGIKAKLGGLADPAKVDAVMAEIPKLKDDPSKAPELLKAVTSLLPPDVQSGIGSSADAFGTAMQAAQQSPDGDMIAKAVQAQAASTSGGAAATPVPAAEAYAKNLEQSKAAIDEARAGLEGTSGPTTEQSLADLQQAEADLAKAPESFDDAVGKALEPLDSMELPEPPTIPDVEADLAAKKQELAEQEAKLRSKHGDHAILGLFTMGNRLIDNAPRPADLVPDLSPIAVMLAGVASKLSEQGASAKALGPLTRLQTKVEDLVDSLPKPKEPPEGEYAEADLKERDFSGERLHGAVFEKADLSKAKFIGSDLTGANFRNANLAGADLSDAILTDADFSSASLTKAILQRVQADRPVFADSALTEADLGDARLTDAKFEQANLVGANLAGAEFANADMQFADLSKSDIRDASFVGANFSMATAKMAKGDRVNFSKIVFDMGSFTHCRFQEANFQEARSSMGSLTNSNLTGADMRGCVFEKVEFMKTIANGANFDTADISQAILRDTKAVGATFRKATLRKVAATGDTDFSKAVFTGADGQRSTWMDVPMSDADFSHGSFENAYLQGCTGDDINFEAARLKGACFRRAEFVRPRFVAADLCSADFTCSSLNDANFRSANCYDLKLLGASAIRSDFQGAFVERLQLDETDSPEKP